ncbi:MAG: fibronectin type III domain-containing protein [Defluviitaleaceae bacterium]|nr:fibronectin type III domain-containing protein [Defluviitaleaceae bacterium]MCL2835747.1 fibronectin type III domain-containing protein [Defluviitaleaceae bacterium]
MGKKSTAANKRVLSWFIALCIMLTALPAAVLAHGPGEGGEIEVSYVLDEWETFPDGVTVTRIGTDDHVLKLDINIGAEDAAEILAGGGAVLEIPFAVAHNSGRRLVAWTDLSGAPNEIDDFTFATRENQEAGIVVRSDLLASGTEHASILIPKELLFDEAANKTASEIYLIFTTDNVDDASTPGGNRGASPRGGVNGVDLAAEFDIFERIMLSAVYTMPCPGDDEIVISDWDIFPDGASVTRIGTDNHVLKLDIVIAPEGVSAILEGEGAVLDIPFAVAHNSGRRLVAWTDLSGAPGEINDFTFATRENQEAGIAVRSDLLASGTEHASVFVPKELLYNEDAEKAAAEIYLILTTDNVDDASTPGGNRGASARGGVNGVDLAAEFDIFKKIMLTVTIPCKCDGGIETVFTHISLAPGANPTEMGFAWFTEKGFTDTAILQLAKYSELVNRAMPENPLEFIGVNGIGSSLFDTNKVTVTGLENDTTYAYRVGNGEEWSRIYTFNTRNPEGSYRIIVVSDPQISNEDDIPVWRNTAGIAVENAPDAAFIMIPGDLVDYANDPAEYYGYLAPRELRSYPVNAAPGNHDLPAFMRQHLEQVAYMPLIYQWPNAHYIEDGLFSGYNFYFSYGNTLYITINSNIKDIEDHRAFMEEAAASHPGAVWRIANYHHDIYGAGDHAGSGYGDSAAMQEDWSPFMDEFGIDIVFNGHDHIHARSYFIRGDDIKKYQMPTVLLQDITQAHPSGAYIAPDGVLYLSLSTAGTKFYDPEMQVWVAYTPGRSDVQEYTVMTVDGGSVTVETYRVDTNEMLDSITIRKTATFDDLQSLILGCEALERGDILEPGWLAFQAEITEAKKVESAGLADDIHNMYVTLYDAFYALEVSTDKAKLTALIIQAAEKLDTAMEGLWAGQYPFGSIAELQLAFDPALVVYEDRLATQEAADAAYAVLDAAFTAFESLVSSIPMPWVYVHEIKAEGVTVVDLLDWMDDGRTYTLGTEPMFRYFTHHTKQEFANDNFGGPRSELFAPANAAGGRGVSEGHITRTHIGEWIRYELDVAEEGMYKVMLGAANDTALDQKVLFRDDRQNILTEFTVPASSPLTDAGWDGALMVEADTEVYLPAGIFVAELFFVNDGVNVNTRNNNPYPDGADFDILTFERTGGGEAPAVIDAPGIYQLPFIPELAAGAAPRQRGWGTPDYVDEWGNAGSVPVNILKAATHLVLELAAPLPTHGGVIIQIQIQSDAIGEWRDNNFIAEDIAGFMDGEKIVIPLDRLTNYDIWRSMESAGRLNVSYYNTGWDEMNFMNAYFILDLNFMD